MSDKVDRKFIKQVFLMVWFEYAAENKNELNKLDFFWTILYRFEQNPKNSNKIILAIMPNFE